MCFFTRLKRWSHVLYQRTYLLPAQGTVLEYIAVRRATDRSISRRDHVGYIKTRTGSSACKMFTVTVTLCRRLR